MAMTISLNRQKKYVFKITFPWRKQLLLGSVFLKIQFKVKLYAETMKKGKFIFKVSSLLCTFLNAPRWYWFECQRTLYHSQFDIANMRYLLGMKDNSRWKKANSGGISKPTASLCLPVPFPGLETMG